jgi:hypothetical protein
MRIVPVYIRGRCEQSGLPKEKVSRYTVRPGTLWIDINYVISNTGLSSVRITFTPLAKIPGTDQGGHVA